MAFSSALFPTATFLALIVFALACTGEAKTQAFMARLAPEEPTQPALVAHGRPVSADPRWNRIWTYWNYPSGPDILLQLNLDSWRRHAPHMDIIFVNESNIRQYVPDCPDEFFRLPYSAAKSDFVRAALLYHQGGVYMDTDFLLMGPMDDILKQLETNDIVAYSEQTELQGTGTACKVPNDPHRGYASNWMAGRRGNKHSQTWWENMKRKVTRTCDKGELQFKKVCCHEAWAPLPEQRSCHVPWGFLEHLKEPSDDLETQGPLEVDMAQPRQEKNHPAWPWTWPIALDAGKNSAAWPWPWPMDSRDPKEIERLRREVALGNQNATQLPNDVRLYCLNGDRSLAPHANGEVYWQSWDPVAHATGTDVGENFDASFSCREARHGDLVCTKTNLGDRSDSPQVMPRFFQRVAYHLFFSTRNWAGNVKSKEEMLQGKWLLSEVYRRALGYTL